MKTGKSIFKAGKLIKIELTYDDKILDIRIRGDFFLYPEDSLEKLQKHLVGVALDKRAIAGRIDAVLLQENITPFGFTSGQLAEAIVGASNQA